MTTSIMSPEWRVRLEATLEAMAASPDRQAAYLSELGTAGSADELALQFDDVFRPLEPQLRERAEAEEVLHALRALDLALSDRSLQWSLEALQKSEQWVRIRILSVQALNLLRPSE